MRQVLWPPAPDAARCETADRHTVGCGENKCAGELDDTCSRSLLKVFMEVKKKKLVKTFNSMLTSAGVCFYPCTHAAYQENYSTV